MTGHYGNRCSWHTAFDFGSWFVPGCAINKVLAKNHFLIQTSTESGAVCFLHLTTCYNINKRKEKNNVTKLKHTEWRRHTFSYWGPLLYTQKLTRLDDLVNHKNYLLFTKSNQIYWSLSYCCLEDVFYNSIYFTFHPAALHRNVWHISRIKEENTSKWLFSSFFWMKCHWLH